MAAWKGGNMGVGEKTGEIVAKINALAGLQDAVSKSISERRDAGEHDESDRGV